jgi:cell pole-organizing protein PopZ
MTNLNGAHEPSMDEILASIRKIIADDVPPQGANAGQSLPLPQPFTASPLGTPRTAPVDAPASLSTRLNDMFGTGAQLPVPTRLEAAARTIRSTLDHDLDDLLDERPQPTPQPASSAGAVRLGIATPDSARRSQAIDFNALATPSPANPITPSVAPTIEAAPQRQAATSTLPPFTSPTPAAAPAGLAANPSPADTQRPAPVVLATAPVGAAAVTPTARASAPLVPAPSIDFTKVVPGPVTAAPAPAAPQTVAAQPVHTAPFQSAAPQTSPLASTTRSHEAAPSPAPAAPLAPVSAVKDEGAPTGPIVLAAMPSRVPIKPAAPTPVTAAVPSHESAPSVAHAAVTDGAHGPSLAPKPDFSSIMTPKPAPTVIATPAPVKAAPVQPVSTSMPDAISAQPTPVQVPLPTSAPVPAAAVSPLSALAIGLDTSVHNAAIATRSADPAADAVASALGALAAGLAASSRPPAVEIVVPDAKTERPSPASQQPGTVGAAASVATAAPEPAPSGKLVASTSVSLFAPNGVLAEPPAVDTSRMDETAAQLLRPMLRQWLDSNMPRIVEKALQIELAENPITNVKSD